MQSWEDHGLWVDANSVVSATMTASRLPVGVMMLCLDRLVLIQSTSLVIPVSIEIEHTKQQAMKIRWEAGDLVVLGS